MSNAVARRRPKIALSAASVAPSRRCLSHRTADCACSSAGRPRSSRSLSIIRPTILRAGFLPVDVYSALRHVDRRVGDIGATATVYRLCTRGELPHVLRVSNGGDHHIKHIKHIKHGQPPTNANLLFWVVITLLRCLRICATSVCGEGE